MATDPATILDPTTPDPVAVDPPAADPVVADPVVAADPPAAEIDWRTRRATDGEAVDDKLLKYLGRFHSEAAYDKATKQIHDDIRNGKYLKPLAEDASDDDRAAWNKALGVPDKPEGYLEKLPEGLVIGDDDKPMVNEFLDAMHKVGAPAGMTAAALDVYYNMVDQQYAAEAELEGTAKRESEDALREEWGQDYRRNLNVVQNYLGTLPEEVREPLMTARDGNGVSLANNASFIKWLTSLSLDANPLATVVPGAGANAGQAIDDEIAALEQRMKSDRIAYFKDEKAQARYLQLIEAKERMK